MSKTVALTDTWQELDTTNDVLVTGVNFALALGVTAAPTGAGEWHRLSQPIVVPKGTGAFIRAGFGSSEVVMSTLGGNGNPLK